MADYFTHFSFIIPKLTAKEKKYIKKELADAPKEGIDFNWEIEESNNLWIYSEGWSSSDEAADFVQMFLEKFRPNDSVGFESSLSCSKPRLDGNGGSAVFITATKQEWINTGGWLSTKQAEWDKKCQKIK